MPLDTNNIRSEEVQDILTKVPHWMIRWGNTLLFALVLLFLLLSWVIKYPDVITAQAILTTETPSQKEFAQVSGKIKNILVTNGQQVGISQNLAVIENTADYEDVQFLKKILDTLTFSRSRFEFPINEIPLLFLGDIDAAYANFENNYLAYSHIKTFKPFEKRKRSQVYTSSEIQLRLDNLQAQEDIQRKELNFQKARLDRNKKLHATGVISTQEFEQEQVQYLTSERNYTAIASRISQLKENQNTSRYTLKLEEGNNSNEEVRLLRATIQSFNSLKKALYDWEKQFILQSEINGEVSFANFWNVNQQVNTGDLVFTIIPEENEKHLARLKVPVFNSGKLKKDQKIFLQLDNYPESEYGKLESNISTISLTADSEDHYLVQASLPKTLITSYNKHLEFKSEMSGSAEIVTEDLRLLERFFYQIRNVLN